MCLLFRCLLFRSFPCMLVISFWDVSTIQMYLLFFLHFEIAVNVKSLIYYSAKSSPCSLPWCATTPSLISPQTFITCLTIVSVVGKQSVKPNTIKLFWSLFLIVVNIFFKTKMEKENNTGKGEREKERERERD